MSTTKITQTLNILKLLFGYWKSKKTAERKITQAVVLELLREGKITSGKAAEFLNMSRWDFMKLMSEHNIPMADFNSGELESQIRDFKKLKQKS